MRGGGGGGSQLGVHLKGFLKLELATIELCVISDKTNFYKAKAKNVFSWQVDEAAARLLSGLRDDRQSSQG
jgi:hypothetical protein